MSCKHVHEHKHLPPWLVKVTWLDAADYCNGWHDLDDLPISNNFFESYGIQFLEDDLSLYLTETIRDDFCVGTIHQIPKGMIQEIKRIKKIKDVWGFESEESKANATLDRIEKALDDIGPATSEKIIKKKVKKSKEKG